MLICPSINTFTSKCLVDMKEYPIKTLIKNSYLGEVENEFPW